MELLFHRDEKNFPINLTNYIKSCIGVPVCIIKRAGTHTRGEKMLPENLLSQKKTMLRVTEFDRTPTGYYYTFSDRTRIWLFYAIGTRGDIIKEKIKVKVLDILNDGRISIPKRRKIWKSPKHLYVSLGNHNFSPKAKNEIHLFRYDRFSEDALKIQIKMLDISEQIWLQYAGEIPM